MYSIETGGAEVKDTWVVTTNNKGEFCSVKISSIGNGRTFLAYTKKEGKIIPVVCVKTNSLDGYEIIKSFDGAKEWANALTYCREIG